MQLNENDRLLCHCRGVANTTDYIRFEFIVDTEAENKNETETVKSH